MMALLSESLPLGLLLGGILSAFATVAAFPESLRRFSGRHAVVYAAALVQIGAQAIQFNNVQTRTEIQRNQALALYAYTQYANPVGSDGAHDLCLLRTYAGATSSIDPNYFLGYARFRLGYTLFKHGDKKGAKREWQAAKGLFEKAIDTRNFVSPSYYLIGTIERLETEGSETPDYSQAADDLRLAVANDPSYEGAKYGLAIIEMRTSSYTSAYSHLSNAVTLGPAACLDINNSDEQSKLWAPLMQSADFGPKFMKLLDCKTKYQWCG